MKINYKILIIICGLVLSSPAFAQDTGFFNAESLSEQHQNRLSVGNYHSCFIQDDGQASCWGKNELFELGDQNYKTNLSALPRDVPLYNASESYVAISAGFAHTCAVTSTGRGRCWGYDNYGNLGNSLKNKINLNANQLVNSGSATPIVNLFTHDGVKQTIELSNIFNIGAGKNHNCAVLHDGSVECWGKAGEFQLGNNKSGKKQAYATAVLGYHGPAVNIPDPECANTCDASCVMPNYMGVMVTGTTANTCLVRFDKKIECWGTESMNAPVNGNNIANIHIESQVQYPQSIFVLDSATNTPLENAIYVAASSFHVCAVVDDDIPDDKMGSVYCWGTNDNGQLGDGTTDDRNMAVKVAGITNATMVDCGEKSTCAVLDDGTVKCWGSQLVGRLGNGQSLSTPQLAPVPVKIDAQTNLSNAVEVSLGFAHGCAYTNTNGNSEVYCWGQNSNGQLGNGTTANSLYAKKVVF